MKSITSVSELDSTCKELNDICKRTQISDSGEEESHGRARDKSSIVVLVEEDALAELAPPPSPGSSLTFQRRTAHFLNPRASTTDPSIDAVSPLPLLRDLLPVIVPPLRPPKIRFSGWFLPDNGWHDWVKRLRRPFLKMWLRAEILHAIAVSTCTVTADKSIFQGLIECWSPETNTFVLPWPSPVEATLTLEDIMVLGGFSVFGEPIRRPPVGDTVEMELLARLTAEYRALELKARSGRVSHGDWTRRFMGSSAGKPSELEHAAFIALWLSRYVFPAPPQDSVGVEVIPLAVRLSRGARVALAPAVLASIYRDLRLLKESAVNCRTEAAATVDVWAPFQFLQLWAWERFEPLRPPKGPRNLHRLGGTALRWHKRGNRQWPLYLVRSVLESPGAFRWRLYSPRRPGVWGTLSGGGRWVTVACSDRGDKYMRCYARCLRACELVGLDCSELYSPRRVAMQFGLDQDIPGPFPAVDGPSSTYGEGTERSLRLYVPSQRYYLAGATKGFFAWQRRCALDREEAARKEAKRRKKQERERIRRRKARKEAKRRKKEEQERRRKAEEGLLQVSGQVLEEKRQDAVEEEMRCSDEAGPTKRMKTMEGEEADTMDAELLALEMEGEKEERAAETCEKEPSSHPLQPPVAAAEPEAEQLPCGVAIVEIESDDEELQRQRDLEFGREIEQLKAEIAGLQAMVKLRESSAQMDAMALSQSG